MGDAPQTGKFDLNIERILEGWGICHAIREAIANALDEQSLTGTKDVEITKDEDGVWHVRDYGRGLRNEHLTQNEDQEKQRNSNKVIGKFGVGLKDALATLHRHRVKVAITSKHGDITLEETAKHGFNNVITLHAVICPPKDPLFVGTDFAFPKVSDQEIRAANNFFLRFSDEEVLDQTKYGQILRRPNSGDARIYVKGLLVAKEEKFAFSYNITSLTAAMNKALNRERTHVGRTAYADRVKEMLLISQSEFVAETLANDLVLMERGTNHDEVKWTEVAANACRILNASRKVLFVTSTDLTNARDSIDHAIKDNYKVITVPDNIRGRLQGVKDIQGNPVRILQVYQREWAESFEFTFVPENKLTASERKIYALRKQIASLDGGLPRSVRDIRISETMRPEVGAVSCPVGLWEPDKKWIIIKRSQLRSIDAFAGTLLHEITHARTGYVDVSRDFEEGLTCSLGRVSAVALKTKNKSTTS